MIDLIKKRLKKIKETKKFATDHNVHSWYNMLLHGIMFVLIGGFLVSLGAIILLDDIESHSTLKGSLLMNGLWGIATTFPFTFAFILALIYLPRIIMLEVLLNEKIQRYMMAGWQKLDMWYFRKYRKHSPLTDSYSKIYEKTTKYTSKLSRNQKKLITIGIVILLVSVQVGIRLPLILETINDLQKDLPQEKPNDLPNPINEKQLEIEVNGGKK